MMHAHLKKVGSPSLEELQNSPGYPSKKDFSRGPIAVIECVEEIPCNPCETSCLKEAIKIGNPITNLPCIDFEKCAGCGICVSACPGLAIYIKDYTYSDNETLITFPFEYFPLPEVGDTVIMAGRMGEAICKGRITKVSHGKMNDHTTLISAVYPKKHFDEVVTMKRI